MAHSPESGSAYTASDGSVDLDDLIYTGPPNPFMGFTENYSATYLTSNNPCIDFFFHIVPNSPPEDLTRMLQQSWDHNPLTSLKLVCNLRGVRGTGKSDRENFYTAALWLHENHPKTLAKNLEIFVQFGYFKDLLEILQRILEGAESRKAKKKEWNLKKAAKGKGKGRVIRFPAKKSAKFGDSEEAEKRRRLRAEVPREKRVAENMEKVKAEMEKARELRKEKEINMAKRARERYDSDGNYRFLHDQISGLFAKILVSDITCMRSGQTNKISLAAKWCPSVDSSYDKVTLICKSIAERMFSRESNQEYEGLEEEEYVRRVRNRLRKEVLVPLHEALKLPEVYMSAKQWGSVDYSSVASVAMKNYTDIFLHRDNKRFREYLRIVQSGDAKIAAGALLPHDIIKSLEGSSGARMVAELQWKRMVEDLSNKGELTNCLAVCDVSYSMSGTPMEVAIALGLLVSELSEEPWKGHVITFSSDPQLHLIEGRNLKSKTNLIRWMDSGYNTNFQKVFDKILEVAVNGNLTQDQMIKRLFVFSDMEFDEASETPWETDYQAIQRKFSEKGYKKVPEIVFWNLRHSSATPVTATENGVAMVSGFSKNLLTLFLEEGGVINPEDSTNLADAKPNAEGAKDEMNPESVMESAIAGELYQKLVVYD